MATNELPHRPNLDHLRRQAKALLAGLSAGERAAIEMLRQHLPAAQSLSEAQVRQAGFRLADAQSAIARQSGFASWPRLARHVEQLRALEGAWEFVTLEMDGGPVDAAMLAGSRLLIDGDRFRTETPGAVYDGVFNIDVEAEPHAIDIEFVEGPEAGNWNYGIFRLEGDTLALCLDTTGRGRPGGFRTAPGSGHAYETLRRASATRPAGVTGGTPQPRPAVAATGNRADFEYVPSAMLERLAGEWSAVSLVRDGQALPAAMCKSGRRVAEKNEIRISFGGQIVIHALVRIDESVDPIRVDYYNLAGPTPGAMQHGIMRWEGAEPCFCMAAPGQPRPEEFAAPAGSGRTLSQWRLDRK